MTNNAPKSAKNSRNKIPETHMKLLRKYFPGINYALHKRIINFQSRLILNKQKRHNWKNLKRQNLTTNLIKNSSWGVSYSVFDFVFKHYQSKRHI